MTRAAEGLAVRCDTQGLVLEVLHNTLPLVRPLDTGAYLSLILTEDNGGKLDDMLAQLAESGAAFDWDINVDTLQGVTTLRFSGAVTGPDLVITATGSVGEICEEFVAMNSELVNSIRTLQKRAAAANVSVEELTKLNDSLLELQHAYTRENNELESNKHLLETILETTPNVVYIFDLEDGVFTYLNSGLARILGISLDAASRLDPHELVSAGGSLEPFGGRQAELMDALDGQILEREYPVRTAGGAARLLASHEKVFSRNTDGTPRTILGIANDITDSRRIEDALRESETSYRRQFAENSSVMLLIDPTDGRIIEANTAAVEFYGYTHDRLLGMRMVEISESSSSEIQEAMASVREDKGARFDFRHRLADGSVRDVDVSSSRIQFGGRPLLHSIIYDVTERRRLEAELEAHAATDSLTRVANRRGFVERADYERARAIRHGRPLALVAMDLDNLKTINDTFGHAAGDAALIAFAQACRDNTRVIDLIARFGGDEFVLLLPETDAAAGREVAERIHAALGSVVVGPEGTSFALAASAGVAVLASGHESLDQLLSRADAALYRAKGLGGDRVEVAP